MATLKDTSTGEDKAYLKDEYKEEQFTEGGDDASFPENVGTDGVPPGTPIDRGNVLRPTGAAPMTIQSEGFTYPTSMKSMWDEGFTGDSYEDLYRHRSAMQPESVKAWYTVGGGILSGIGTAIEDIGYLADYNTYLNMVMDVDFSTANSIGMFNSPGSMLSELGRGLKHLTEEDIMPVYERPAIEGDYTDMLFKWGSLKSVIDSAVGFTATGFGAGAAVKGLTKLGIKGLSAAGKLTAKGLANSSKLTRLQKLALKTSRVDSYMGMFASKNPKVVQTMGAAATGLMTKGAEARMEGLEAYESYMAKGQSLVDNGVITQDQLETQASIAAQDVFDMTMATAAGDMLMLKGLFRGKSLVNKKLSKPSLWNRSKGSLWGAPKEGFEEMWQEAAKMEGDYQVFNNIKKSIQDDEKLKKMKALGFDPSQHPERYIERLGTFLDSTQAQVAGTIGLVSGPFQAALLGAPGRKNRIKQDWDAYNAQQSRYKDNIKLFSAQHRFKENVKQVGTAQEMREISQLLADDTLGEIAEETALMGVAIGNFMEGTTDQLKSTIREENTPESNRYLSTLAKYEKDFKKARRYLNPNEIFVLEKSIETSKKIISHLNSYARNPDLDDKTAKSYEKAAEKQHKVLLDLQEEHKEKTSRGYQLNLIKQEQYADEVEKVSDSISNSKSITKLEGIITKYPELASQAQAKITELKNNGNSGKTTTTEKKSNTKTNKSKKASPNSSTTKGQQRTIANKNINKQTLTKEEKKEMAKSEALIKEITVDERMEKQSAGRSKDNEGNVYNAFGIPVQSRGDFKANFNQERLQSMLNGYAADTEGAKVQATANMVNELADHYMSVIDQVESTAQLKQLLQSKVTDLYSVGTSTKPVASTTEDEMASALDDEPIQEVSKDLPKSGLIAQSAKNFLDVLSEDEVDEIIDPGTNENKDGRQKFEKLKKEQEALNDFIDTLFDAGIDVMGDFPALIDELVKASENPALVQKYYPRIKALYSLLTGETITDTYSDVMGINEPDPSIEPDMVSPEKIKNAVKVAVKYISPTQNTKELQELYTDEEVENVDNKNKTPATSVAHLSQKWVWEVKGEKQVGRITSDTTVDGNPILNPEKYNTGTPIKIELNTEYDGKIQLGKKLVSWQVMLEEYRLGDWEHFVKEHKLAYDTTIYDHYPLTITGIEDNEMIGFVHDTAWVNKLNAPDKVIEDNRKMLKDFRATIVPQMLASPGFIFETTISEKVLEINKDGVYSGFALNTGNTAENAAESLPDPDLAIGVQVVSDIEVPGKKSIIKNTMNEPFLEEYNSGTAMVFVPLSKKDGKMKYHAAPLFNNKLSPNQARGLRQAMEIFLTENPEVNVGLYEAYKRLNIDLLTPRGLDTVLRKALRLYRSDSKDGIKRQSLEKMIESRIGKAGLGFVEFTNDEIHYGKSVKKSMKKGGRISTEELDKMEKFVLQSAYFNVSKELLNSKEKFNFVEVDVETGELAPYEGDYNTYVKQNTTTFMRSTKLDDGSYSSTIQNITRFDMKVPESIKEEGLEVKEKEVTEDPGKDPEAIKLANLMGEDIDTFIKPVREGKISLEKYLKAKRMVHEANKHSKHTKNCN